jgi:glycosyltransferase involved in cell wall biosynthesis
VHLDLEAWPGPAGWPRLGGLYRSFADPAIEGMAHVYVVSERGAQLLRDSHPAIAGRIDFVPVWHDPAVFRAPTTPEHDALRLSEFGRLAIAADAQVVLWAGRLDAGKNPLLALDAVARATSDSGAIELIIAGDGELRAAAEEQATALGIGGRVHFLGDVPRDEIARLMRVADCLLLTSHSEGGGPRVVVEALASGLPVVATDVGEVRRTVADRINGRIADDHAPQTLADALTWTLAQPRDSLSAAAVSAAAPYTAERVLAPLYATYRELVAATR